MQAVKLNGVVKDRELRIVVPREIPEGNVEVFIVANAAEDSPNPKLASLRSLLKRIAERPGPRKSDEEVERLIRQLREN